MDVCNRNIAIAVILRVLVDLSLSLSLSLFRAREIASVAAVFMLLFAVSAVEHKKCKNDKI